MKKNRLNELNVFHSAGSELQKNPPEYIPVFLLLGLCILALSVFSNNSYLFQEKFTPASTESEKYVWITGSPRVKEGLYLFTPEQFEKTFPEVLPPVSIASAPPEFDSMVSAIEYNSGFPQSVNLPPAVANIFFQPISINRAEEEILSTLPGIGPMLAARIVHIRKSRGPFRSKNELLHISGIGPQKLARLVHYITLD